MLAWELERPPADITIDEREDTNKCNGEAAVGLGINVYSYLEKWGRYGYHDTLSFRAAVTANTREIIDYSADYAYYEWYELGNDKQIPNPGASYVDDGLINLADVDPVLTYFVRFYGGPKSGECVWTNFNPLYVSTNGFICFDWFTEDESYPIRNDSLVGNWKRYPYDIPDHRGPNAFIAPFWTDLRPDLGGKIKAGIVTWGANYDNALCVTWENIPDTNGHNQTFQVLISFPAQGNFEQSVIQFQYKHVVSNSAVKIGIESQTGIKGTSVDPSNVGNEKALVLSQSTSCAFISQLTIKIIKVTPSGDIWILRNSNFARGYNVKLESDQPDPGMTFKVALAGDLALLVVGALIPPVAGFMLGLGVITLKTLNYLATSMSPAKDVNIVDGTDVNFAKAHASAMVVDAAFGIEADWVLEDESNQEIRVIAELEYFICDKHGGFLGNGTLITDQIPITLKHDVGNSINDPNVKQIGFGTYRGVLGGEDSSDFYRICLNESSLGKKLVIWLFVPNGTDYDLYLYKPSVVPPVSYSASRSAGGTEFIMYPINSLGNWSIEVRLYAGVGIYRLQVDAYYFEGGCPFVHVWNGQEYTVDNNLLPNSAKSGGADVEDFYRLQQISIPVYQNQLFSLYSFQIREFQTEHSYLDQVKLSAVDHQPDVNVAVAQTGEILTYKNPHPPVSCTNEYGYNMLDRIRNIDQEYYQSYPDSYLLLNFGNLSIQEDAKLVMRADDVIKESIHVQILNETGEWQTVAKIIPRINWATEIINLAPYLPNSTGNLQIRLYFTAFHKLDYVGLDTTPQAEVTIRQGFLVSAIHSEQGPVTLRLLRNDQIYAELTPNQQIDLLFALPQKQNQTTTTTFIFYTEGHYNTIK